jgi:RNA polymerase sigma factor (sigma-70 family)
VEDGALVAQCLAGDDAGWQQLLGRYCGLVEAIIRRYHLPADEQADVFQDVWVALWRDLPSLRSHARLGPWLVTITGRLAWDARKRLPQRVERDASELILASLVDEAADPEQEAARRELREHVRIALSLVSPRCRVLLEALFFDEASSYSELAARLGCSPNSIGPIRARCFGELRAMFDAGRVERQSGRQRADALGSA